MSQTGQWRCQNQNCRNEIYEGNDKMHLAELEKKKKNNRIENNS